MSDPTDAAIDALVGEAMGALDNAMSVHDNERYRVKLLQLAPTMIDAITALRAERAKDHAEINLKADFIEATLNQLAASEETIENLRAERDAWKSQCEAVQREAEKCFSAQEEIDAAWDAFGTSGNRKVLSLAEQIASHQREVDDARTAYARGVQAALHEFDTGTEWMEIRDAIRALASTPPAPVVGVKPLVWRVQSSDCQISDTPWGACAVQNESHVLSPNRWGWWAVGCDEDDSPSGYEIDILAAKAAAQADYEARILAALLPQAGGDA